MRVSVAGLLKQRSGPDAVRAAMSSPSRIDRPLWQTLCTEIGVAALPVPDEFGGAGAGFAETGVILEETGAVLCPVPVYSAAIATAAILATGDTDAARRLLPGIASGEKSVALCWAGPDGWAAPGVTAEAGLLTGTAHYVLDGESADHLLVLAGTSSGLTVHDVDAHAEGITITPRPVVDPTRPLASVTFDDVAATTITAKADTEDTLRTAAWALLSAEQVGGAARTLDLTVQYTKERSQFGRPIGSFQALKHRMADMYTLVETSRSISRAALDAVAAGAADAPELAAAAHVYCSESFATVTGEAIQLHGGIGITWEHDIQLYFKRAHGSALLFGQPHRVVTELAKRLHGAMTAQPPTSR
ncbi:acyl-CoA dehydrogenase [Gordonia desulfuricans]|uniref:Acyl-CoA dehydrogenase n=1 Tax=Gordonia desulfuricans TaxID=89051 RepID=A0A7K3LKN4_9ACTN|nr:acyl-CoA dehydrogenase [Gordonia desulfuricans]